MLRTLFQDRAIDQSALDEMHFNIMDYVRCHPLNFEEQLARHRRRQWGIIAGVVLVLAGLAATLIQFFIGDQVFSGLHHMLIGVLQYLPIAWVSDFWPVLFERLEALTRLLAAIKATWQHYSSLVMVVLSLWVIQRGFQRKDRFSGRKTQ